MSEWLLKRCERARSAVPDHHEPYVSLHPDTVEAGARLAEAVREYLDALRPNQHPALFSALADYDRAIAEERGRQER